MKPFKMIGIAIAAFALASLAMVAGPSLVEHGIALAHSQRTGAAPVAKHDSAPAAKPDATAKPSALESTAIATAQEATSLPQ